MKWAVGFLVLSCLVTAAGVGLLVLRINEGLVNSSIDAQHTGAFTGDRAATPTGDDLPVNRSGAAATITATIREVTAAAATAIAVKTPLANGGSVDVVPVGQPVELGGSRFTVLQVLDPEPPGLFKTEAGKRRVAIELTQQSVSGTQRYHFAQFVLRDASGGLHTWAITNGEPAFNVGQLEAGQSRTGWISFQVPEAAVLDALVFDPLGAGEARAIVDLR
jgi:hypothetical protein